MGPDDYGIYFPKIAGPSCMHSRQSIERILNTIPTAGTFCELGTWTGSTISWIADYRPNATLVAVDIFNRETLVNLLLFAANKRPNVNLWWGSAESFARSTRLKFHSVLVDTFHDYHNVISTLSSADQITNRTIFVHDYGDPNHPEVKAAVDDYCAKTNWEVIDDTDHLAVLE
jgi:hypothetical protein